MQLNAGRKAFCQIMSFDLPLGSARPCRSSRLPTWFTQQRPITTKYLVIIQHRTKTDAPPQSSHYTNLSEGTGSPGVDLEGTLDEHKTAASVSQQVVSGYLHGYIGQ
ncbi:hypothetical protein KXV53_000791 [Aspergillus fumigatus]|nr:hypothetical protein KXV53_000791 [Aspergillus fumigatus]